MASTELVPTGERTVHSAYKGPGGVGPTEGRVWKMGPTGVGSGWYPPGLEDLHHDRRVEGRRNAPTDRSTLHAEGKNPSFGASMGQSMSGMGMPTSLGL